MENSPLANGVRTLVPAPEGYVVNFDNPPSQKVLDHYLITGILGPLAFIALCQRYYTKLFLSKGLQVDDGESAAQEKGVVLPGKRLSLTCHAQLSCSWLG
jgi:hypothetical protein